MNTIEVERLVRRIGSTLKGEGDPSVEGKLADDFNAACASVTLRLEQCRTMIAAGAAAQAIQLAETAPNLLDLVTLLEFRQADEWRQYCRSKGLTCPEKLSPQSVAALNQCYSSGITPQHPAYAVYREAVFAKNDEAAVTALRSIVRLNPADANATAELDRLDAKLLASRLARLEPLLAADKRAAIREVEAMEIFGYKTRVAGPVWQRGQMLRCEAFLNEGEELMIAGRLPELVTLLDFLAELRSKYSLDWPEDWGYRFDTLQSWCRAESSARQKEEQYQGAKKQLLQTLLAGEEKLGRKQPCKFAELKAELAGLEQVYGKLQSFPIPLPEGLAERFHRHTGALGTKIKQQTRFRLSLVMAGVAAAVLMLLAMAGAYLGLQRANTLTAALRQTQAKHEVRALQALLQQARGGWLIHTPQLQAASLAAADEIDRQLPALAGFDAAFQQLPGKFDQVTTIQQLGSVAGAYQAAQQAREGLAPDLLQETQTRLDDFRARWISHCQQLLPALTQQLDDSLRTQEAATAKLDQLAELNQYRAIVVSTIPQVDQLAQSMDSLAVFALPWGDLPARCKSLQDKLSEDQKQLAELDDSVDRLARAQNLSDYGSAMAGLAAIPIKQSLYCQFASQSPRLGGLKEDPEAIARYLLTGTNAFLWAGLKTAPSLSLVPARVTSAGRKLFMTMERDFAVNGTHMDYRLSSDQDPSKNVEWITAQPIVPAAEQWGKVDGWIVNPDGPCKFASLDIGYFGGQYRTSDNGINFNLSVTSLTGLTAIWETSGFNQLINTRNSTFGLAPIHLADTLCSATNGSPLFRAYLLQQLLSIMALQADATGLAFSPGLQALPARFQAVGADQIHSGDWFVAKRVAALQTGLESLFASLQDNSFEAPAAAIFKAIGLAAQNNFGYVGYARPDGSPSWTEPPAEGLVFGWPVGRAEPELLFSVREGQIHSVNSALPLTPLMLYRGDLSDIMSRAGVSPAAPIFKGMLPPLFGTATGLP